MNFIETFARKVKELRKGKDWAQLDLAEKLEYRGYQQIWRWENEKGDPTLSTVEKAAGALGVPSWQLLLSEEQIAEIRANLPISSDGLTPCYKAGANRKTYDVTTISGDARAIMGLGAF